MYKKFVCLAVVLSLACNVSAGMITWDSAFDVVGPADVITTGTSHEAINASSVTGEVVIRGVTFTNSDDLLPGSSGANFLDGSTTGDAEYDALLNKLDFGGGTSTTISIGGGTLIPRATYVVQVWFTDLRSDCNTRVMTFGDDLGNTVDVHASTGGFGQYAVGLFTADGTGSQTLSLLTNGFGNAHITAYQLRDIVSDKATYPQPPNNATVSTTSVTLSWNPIASVRNINGHRVYFGDNFNNVKDGVGSTFVGAQSGESLIVGVPGKPYPDGLVAGTTYYWRIDEVEDDGMTIHEGDVWSFNVAAQPDYGNIVGARFLPTGFTAWGKLDLSVGQSIHFDTSWATFSIDDGDAQSGFIAQTRRATETAVFCFTNVTIPDGVTVTLTGDRPIAILSQGDMTIGTTIDASGGDGANTSGGPGRVGGGDGGTGQMAEIAPTAGQGPGAGGAPPQLWAWHGGGGGGYGGPGGFSGTKSGRPSPGGLSYNITGELEIDLLGGSGGGGGYHWGGADPKGGCAGAGGGAIELTAGGNITILSTGQILANGGDGPNAHWISGGGGGSGGMVLICAGETVNLKRGSQITAKGGSGGSSLSGEGGGGGGGGGGQVAIYYEDLRNNCQISVSGGSGGTGPGQADGEDGYAGRIMMRQHGATLNAPAELQFGKVDPTEAISLEFYLENFEHIPAYVESITVTGQDENYFEVLSPIGSFTVKPGLLNRVPMTIRFNPIQDREYKASLDINSDGGYSSIRLLGKGVAGAAYPVVHYSMDDDNELTTITNTSGIDFHGQRANMPACHWIDGRFSSGKALNFDGLNDHIIVPNIYPMTTTSIAMWVKPDQLTNHSYSSLYSCNGWDNGDISLRFKDDGTLEFAVCGNTGGNVSAEVVNSIYHRFEEFAGTHAIDAHKGFWIHLAIVYDSMAGTADFYVNGMPNVQRTFSNALPASFAGGQIGGWDNGGMNYDGIIDDFRIYDCELSPEQIEELAKFEYELWGVRDIYDWESPSTVIHVNGQAGNDINPGTQEQPVATIGKALELVPGSGTKVLISPGTYREANLELTKSGTRFEPIIIEADEPGSVIISGSEIWNGWRSIGNDTYTHAWPYDWGLSMLDRNLSLSDITRRREMIFVDGELYTQILDLTDAEVKTYCVDEDTNTIYLIMPPDENPTNHMVEVVTNELLFICSRNYCVLRGLTFQHANPFITDSDSVRVEGSYVLIEDCSFHYSNNNGLKFGYPGSKNIVIRRSNGSHNGNQGFTPLYYSNFDALIEDCITNYNYWRGYWGGSWGNGGMKLWHASKHMVLRRHETVGNLTNGLWFDADNRNVLVEDCLIAHNLVHGIWSEINPDGVVIRNCVIADNQQGGVVVSNSEHLVIENNKIFGNNRQQLGMWEPDEYRDEGDHLGESFVTRNLVLRNNWIVGETSSEKLLNWAGWSGLYSTMISHNNKWYRRDWVRDGFFVDWSNLTWNQWRNLVPQDTTSVYLNSKPDLSPPIPDPLHWQVEPRATGDTSITMTAATAMDEASGVEYYFCNLTDRTHNSGWQSEPSYHDTGLTPGRKYFYRVRARDSSEELNETWWSIPACATTHSNNR